METELKRERPEAGVVAEVVLKPLRLPVWKVMVDCLDIVVEKGGQEELPMWVRVKGDKEEKASGEPQAPWLLWASGRGGPVLMEASDGIT